MEKVFEEIMSDATQKKHVISYEGEAKLLRRILNGSLLYDAKIKACEEEGNEKGANSWKFLQISKLCSMRELGGSETYPIDVLDREIDRLKTLLSVS